MDVSDSIFEFCALTRRNTLRLERWAVMDLVIFLSFIFKISSFSLGWWKDISSKRERKSFC